MGKYDKPWELYDLTKDRIEANDLSAKMPERTREMRAKYESWAARANVAPWPVNPAKKTKTGE